MLFIGDDHVWRIRMRIGQLLLGKNNVIFYQVAAIYFLCTPGVEAKCLDLRKYIL